jgi:hypothetical protein
MAKRMKLFCECGGTFATKIVVREGIRHEVEVCSGCSRLMYLQSQSRFFNNARLRRARFAVDRKIIRIGNSIGVTLPEGFAKLGQKVHFVQKDAHRMELIIGTAPISYKVYLEGDATAQKWIR